MSMSQLNDQQAFVNKSGNLTLGNSGADDAAGNSSYGYAKNDITMPVSATIIVSDTQPALTYGTGDIPFRTLAASTTHKVSVPFPQWFNRTFVGTNSAQANANCPHGVLIKTLTLYYRVNTTTITSFTTFAINYMAMAAAAGLPTVTALTTTLAGNTLTAAANVYAAVATVTTPVWVNTADVVPWGLATIVTPGSSTVDILGASWACAVALY